MHGERTSTNKKLKLTSTVNRSTTKTIILLTPCWASPPPRCSIEGGGVIDGERVCSTI